MELLTGLGQKLPTGLGKMLTGLAKILTGQEKSHLTGLLVWLLLLILCTGDRHSDALETTGLKIYQCTNRIFRLNDAQIGLFYDFC